MAYERDDDLQGRDERAAGPTEASAQADARDDRNFRGGGTGWVPGDGRGPDLREQQRDEERSAGLPDADGDRATDGDGAVNLDRAFSGTY